MKAHFTLTIILGIILPLSAFAQPLADLVDTRVGTAIAITKTAGVFGQGTEEFAHTLPAVLVPFGMNFWTPETQASEKKGVCPYLYKDNAIRGFRCSHWIVGGCTQDYGSFTISPFADAEASAYSHETETARPYYYSVSLDGGVKAEMTATDRCGLMRFTFENPDAACVRIHVNSDRNEGELLYDSVNNRIYGRNPCHRIYQGKGELTGVSGWLCVECSKTVLSYKKIDNQTILLCFAATEEVMVKAACSFTGKDGALNNLLAELPHWNFEKVKSQLADTWEKKLSQITVSAPTPIFYTAMYHASFLPHHINDVDGAYPKFADGTVVRTTEEGRGDYYDDFSMWDTYRAQHPLLCLLEPSRNGDMMQSLVTKYEEGGWMPIFPCWNSYTAAMIGDHCAAAIADAYVKGIRNFDIVKAYEGMRKNAFETPATYDEYKNGMGRRALESYLKYGYIPLEDSVKEAYHQHEQTSRTLEYAYDDYALAQVARLMAEDETIADSDLAACGLSRQSLLADYKNLIRRSSNWKNIFNAAAGWVGGRHADGSFANVDDIQYIKEPEKHPDAKSLTPATFSTFITEGTPVHYSWYVPHDIEGIVEAMGGRKKMEAKLDSMFSQGWYWHGNEPCHQIAYLYSAIGKQNKTIEAVRNIMQTEYLFAPGGLSGNDDAGQMSAWYIFSALGFYPVCPSTPYYYLGAPAFSDIKVRLENGNTLHITAPGIERGLTKVKQVYINGKQLSSSCISHEDLKNSATIMFEMQ